MAANTNKNFRKGLLISVMLGAMLALVPQAFAGDFLPLPGKSDLDIPTAEGDTAVEKLENVLGPVAKTLRIIIGAVAVIMIVISGFGMVVGGENEGTVKDQKKSITWGVIGLLMISIAGPIAEIFDYRQGNLLESGETLVERAQLFDDTTRIVITFIKYLLGSLAALMFIRAGATMIMNSGSQEEIDREKKNLSLAAGGLFMVFISDLVIRKILYNTEYNTSSSETVVSINQSELVKQVVAVTNLMITFVGPIMVLGIVVGGILYVTAGGEQGRIDLAKKIMINCVIGVVVIYGAFALVSTIITGVF